MSFEFAPPDNAVLQILEIKFSLEDDNLYTGITDYSLFVEITEEEEEESNDQADAITSSIFENAS